MIEKYLKEVLKVKDEFENVLNSHTMLSHTESFMLTLRYILLYTFILSEHLSSHLIVYGLLTIDESFKDISSHYPLFVKLQIASLEELEKPTAQQAVAAEPTTYLMLTGRKSEVIQRMLIHLSIVSLNYSLRSVMLTNLNTKAQ